MSFPRRSISPSPTRSVGANAYRPRSARVHLKPPRRPRHRDRTLPAQTRDQPDSLVRPDQAPAGEARAGRMSASRHGPADLAPSREEPGTEATTDHARHLTAGKRRGAAPGTADPSATRAAGRRCRAPSPPSRAHPPAAERTARRCPRDASNGARFLRSITETIAGSLPFSLPWKAPPGGKRRGPAKPIPQSIPSPLTCYLVALVAPSAVLRASDGVIGRRANLTSQPTREPARYDRRRRTSARSTIRRGQSRAIVDSTTRDCQSRI
jgi:hypothetical protein